jgi:hypothetical protein
VASTISAVSTAESLAFIGALLMPVMGAVIVPETSGTVSDEEFAAIKAAGYSDAQLVEISLAFATTVFTNVFNRINDTEIDFPPSHEATERSVRSPA